MLKVKIYENGKLLAIHKYSTEEAANAAKFAIHNHPLFGYRTVIDK